ncbi:MAG: hypothetical protein FD167_4124 [bacterium]|nr:MAG: hypothetical protein FD167_4124 [bacterium]
MPNAEYLPDKVMLDGYERDIAVIYQKGLESAAQESAAYLKNNLPKIQSFFGLPVSWSMLVVNLREGSKSAGGTSKDGIGLINASYPNLPTTEILRHTMGHEGGHTIVSQNQIAQIPVGSLWYNESMAELGYNVAEGNIDGLLDRLNELEKKAAWSYKPLAAFTLEDHKRTVEHVNRGRQLLLTYREIAGHDAFKRFANDVNTLGQSYMIGDNDLIEPKEKKLLYDRLVRENDRLLRERMLHHTPESSKANVAAMYDSAVYGVK